MAFQGGDLLAVLCIPDARGLVHRRGHHSPDDLRFEDGAP
jgi:hypothetical protein